MVQVDFHLNQTPLKKKKKYKKGKNGKKGAEEGKNHTFYCQNK